MSFAPLSPQPSDNLQFETAEMGRSGGSQPSGHDCAICRQPITSTYYSIRDKLVCPACRAAVAGPTSGSPVGRFIVAALFGLGAGLVGTVIWCVVREVTHGEFGIVAMLVGYMVGKAVRKGSGGWGGRDYQVLAVLITYVCISASFVPEILQAIRANAGQKQHAKLAGAKPANSKDNGGAPQKGAADATDPRDDSVPADRSPLSVVMALGILLAFCLKLPILVGCDRPIMLIIFGIGLWEAWRFSARLVLPINGPFQLGPRPT
jgi:hypothetical protein